MSDVVRRARHDIATHGWHLCHVLSEPPEPPFSYTVGLSSTFSHPELIVFGLNTEQSAGILEAAVGLVQSGVRFQDRTKTKALLGSAEVWLVSIPERFHSELAGVAQRTLATGFELLQIVWPGPNNSFPGDVGVAPPTNQPVPGIGWLGSLELPSE